MKVARAECELALNQHRVSTWDRNMQPMRPASGSRGPKAMQRSFEAETMSGRRRAAAKAFIPLFSYGFRPFFLGAALWTVVAMARWLGSIAGLWPTGTALRHGTPTR